MYKSRRSLRTEYDISNSTVDRILRYMRQCIGTGKYPRDTILYIGGHPRVDEDRFKRAIAEMEAKRWTR